MSLILNVDTDDLAQAIKEMSTAEVIHLIKDVSEADFDSSYYYELYKYFKNKCNV